MASETEVVVGFVVLGVRLKVVDADDDLGVDVDDELESSSSADDNGTKAKRIKEMMKKN